MTEQLRRAGRRLRRPRNVVILAVVAMLCTALGWALAQLAADREAEATRAENAVVTAEQLCQQVRQLGQQCVADPDELRGDPGEPGEPGPPPSDAQVYAAVSTWFQANGTTEVDPGSLATAVASYFAANPITSEQLLDAVDVYLTEHPPEPGPAGSPGPQGETGPAGETGPPPTAEEITAALEAWLAEHPLPLCPTGYTPEPQQLLTLDGGTVEAIICVRV